MVARSSRWRIFVVAVVLFGAFSLLIAQLVRWQVLQRGIFLPESRTSTTAGQAPGQGAERGVITDIYGELLAFDTYRWEVWVEPRMVPQDEAASLAAQLSQTLGSSMAISPQDLAGELAERRPGIVMLSRDAPEPAGELIRSWQRNDVGIRPIPTRYYPQGSLFSHMLGFVNGEPRAYYGVEENYDDYLRAVDPPFFRSNLGVQVAYSRLPEAWQSVLPSSTGQDIVLTVDRRVQSLVSKVLAEAIGTYQAQSGTIIVMEPSTGAILAMVSLPSYDPNRYGVTNDTVLADPAVSRQYEPGSVFKIVTMSAGIDAGLITADTVLTDSLKMEVGGQTIQNSDKRSHGQVDIRETLVRSLNIPTAQVALQLQESLFYQYVKRFGFGQKTEVDLANESPGTVKVPGDLLWSKSDLATNAFGQGLAVTPLQMATATAVIANGGMLVRPHVVDARVFRGRVLKPDTDPVRRVLKPETASQMTDLMISVVEQGAPGAYVRGYTVAGKTGTAQIAVEGGYSPTDTIHSFVGFAPAWSPKFVILVKLDKPKANSWAVNTAAPTFGKLARELLRTMHVPPEQIANQP